MPVSLVFRPALRFPVTWIVMLVCGFPPPLARAAESPGQADLDAAIDVKLSADSRDDLTAVIDLCQQAIDKGLTPDSNDFANALLTGSLVDRARMVFDAIFDGPAAGFPPAARRRIDPAWPRMRSLAMQDLNEATRRDSNLAKAQLMIAQLEALPGGDQDRARKSAEKALELFGDDKLSACRAQLVLGQLAADDKEREAAYDSAVELAPRDVEARWTRGLFYLLKNRFAEARVDFEVAIE